MSITLTMLRDPPASLVASGSSSSLLIRRFRPIQAIVRSTTHRLGSPPRKPVWLAGKRTYANHTVRQSDKSPCGTQCPRDVNDGGLLALGHFA